MTTPQQLALVSQFASERRRDSSTEYRLGRSILSYQVVAPELRRREVAG